MAMSDAVVIAIQRHQTVVQPAATFQNVQIQSTALFNITISVMVSNV